MEIVFPTTPSQYFHLLRRQMLRQHRKPLIVFSPKSLLRHLDCVSDLNEFGESFKFKKILVDHPPNNRNAKKLILCSGKHYYTLKEHMNTNKIDEVALVRIEQLSPFPSLELKEIFERYKNVKGKLLNYLT